MGVTVLTRPAFLFPHHDEDGTGGATAPGSNIYYKT
ncbi:hypothetical protein HaLaN_20504 [Haematococcus lacustris]|uniref:Uncharacterized protein n=1 Tax=Haematococcus lacustris TaxID=44745 RepID=A0A699ZL05_HAELA|nr:hypothetical protein HaLaN_20504 [Haematococcus lacustris]